MQTKRDFAYNPEVEKKVRQWIEAVLGAPLPVDACGVGDASSAATGGGGEFQRALSSGVVLCRLFNALYPRREPLKPYEGAYVGARRWRID